MRLMQGLPNISLKAKRIEFGGIEEIYTGIKSHINNLVSSLLVEVTAHLEFSASPEGRRPQA
jgi:hypothetical protein